MKKIILAAGCLFIMAATTSSCKKDYTCKCTKTVTVGSTSTTTDYSVYTYRENLKRAEDRCNDNDGSGTDILGNTYTINCDIQ